MSFLRAKYIYFLKEEKKKSLVSPILLVIKGDLFRQPTKSRAFLEHTGTEGICSKDTVNSTF